MSYTNRTKHTGTPTNQTKNVGSTTNSFLLKEDGFYLLQETGDKIITISAAGSSWINQTKH